MLYCICEQPSIENNRVLYMHHINTVEMVDSWTLEKQD